MWAVLNVVITMYGYVYLNFLCIHRKFRILVKNIRLSWSGLWVLIMLLYSDVVHTSVSILHCPMLTGYDGKKSMVYKHCIFIYTYLCNCIHTDLHLTTSYR